MKDFKEFKWLLQLMGCWLAPSPISGSTWPSSEQTLLQSKSPAENTSLWQKQTNVNSRAYRHACKELSIMPGKCKSNARLPTFAIQTFWALCLHKTIHLMQHTNNPKAFSLYFHQLQTSLDTPQLDPIYPSHAIAPWARQNYWKSSYKYNTYVIYTWNHITCDVHVRPQLTSPPSW